MIGFSGFFRTLTIIGSMLLGSTIAASLTGCDAMATETSGSGDGGAGGSDTQNCDPGTNKQCYCGGDATDKPSGVQTCKDKGDGYTACHCSGNNTGGSGGSAGGSGGAGGDTNTSTSTPTDTGTQTGTGVAADGEPCANGVVTYTVTAAATKAESVRMEGGTTSLNATGKDTAIDPETGETVVTGWVIIKPGEQLINGDYPATRSWTFAGCADKSFRYNTRGWSSQPVPGAPNNDGYSCTLYWVDDLSPTLTRSCTKPDGTPGKLVNEAIVENWNPDHEGRNCSMHCE